MSFSPLFFRLFFLFWIRDKLASTFTNNRDKIVVGVRESIICALSCAYSNSLSIRFLHIIPHLQSHTAPSTYKNFHPLDTKGRENIDIYHYQKHLQLQFNNISTHREAKTTEQLAREVACTCNIRVTGILRSKMQQLLF